MSKPATSPYMKSLIEALNRVATQPNEKGEWNDCAQLCHATVVEITRLIEEREKLREALEQTTEALNDEAVNSAFEKTIGLQWDRGVEASMKAKAALASLEKDNEKESS